MMSIDRRIRQIRAITGLSQEEFGTRVEVSTQAVSQWETADKAGQARKPPRPSKASMIRIAREFDIRLEWLMSGTGPMTDGEVSSEDVSAALGGEHLDSADVANGVTHAGRSVALIGGTLHYKPSQKNALPELRDASGAGEGHAGAEQVYALDVGGSYVGHEVAGEWLIPDHFLRGRLNAAPRGTMIMPVVGESMRPTLEPDDRVIVSVAENKLGADGVYVIAIGDYEPQVKRLIRVIVDGKPMIRVVSDNGGISNDVRPSDIRVIGRVVGRVSRM